MPLSRTNRSGVHIRQHLTVEELSDNGWQRRRSDAEPCEAVFLVNDAISDQMSKGERLTPRTCLSVSGDQKNLEDETAVKDGHLQYLCGTRRGSIEKAESQDFIDSP